MNIHMIDGNLKVAPEVLYIAWRLAVHHDDWLDLDNIGDEDPTPEGDYHVFDGDEELVDLVYREPQCPYTWEQMFTVWAQVTPQYALQRARARGYARWTPLTKDVLHALATATIQYAAMGSYHDTYLQMTDETGHYAWHHADWITFISQYDKKIRSDALNVIEEYKKRLELFHGDS